MAATPALISVLTIFLYFSSVINAEMGTCFCAFYANESINELLMVRNPAYEIHCDAEEKTRCKNMCLNLAHAAKDNIPQLLCEYVKKPLYNVKPAVFSKACANDYEYTGFTGETEVCCDEKGRNFICSA